MEKRFKKDFFHLFLRRVWCSERRHCDCEQSEVGSKRRINHQPPINNSITMMSEKSVLSLPKGYQSLFHKIRLMNICILPVVWNYLLLQGSNARLTGRAGI